MRTRILLVLLPALLSQAGCFLDSYPPPQEPYTLSWTGGPLVWPSAVVRSMYKNTGKFIPKNLLGTRAVVFRDEVFVAFPRFLNGVPATLARTPLLSTDYQAVFQPFPSWEAQTEGDCDALQNVVDLFLDRRDVLWVLDTGVVNTLEKPRKICPPSVVGFDPLTGKRLHKVDLTSLTSPESRLQYLATDIDTQGRQYLYISDAGARAILVYNLAESTGYRMVLPEGAADGCPGGVLDVLYLTMAKPNTGGRRLYFTSLSGNNFYSIRTDDLRNPSDKRAADLAADSKPGKMVVIGSDGVSNIYFRIEGKGDVFSWDVNTPLLHEYIEKVYEGDSCLLATHAVWDPLRLKMRILQCNFLDFFRRTVGLGPVHVLRSIPSFL